MIDDKRSISFPSLVKKLTPLHLCHGAGTSFFSNLFNSFAFYTISFSKRVLDGLFGCFLDFIGAIYEVGEEVSLNTVNKPVKRVIVLIDPKCCKVSIPLLSLLF